MADMIKEDADRLRMIEINEKQRAFYESEHSKRGNVATRIWSNARNSMMKVRRELQITPLLYDLHLKWLGDVKGKRVLDLGCYSGNSLSLHLATESAFYIGIDLSEPAIEKLRQKIRERNLPHADARPLDFLAPDFPYEPFDIIYAYSVMHHFQHFDAFLKVLRERLVPGGRVVTMDPMQTAWSMWLARKLYRPFQSDANWEWPFSKKSFQMIEKYFHIEAIQGVMGYSKFAVPIALVPGATEIAKRLGKHWHQKDLELSRQQGRGLWRCMQVAMFLRRRDDI